MYQLKKGLFIQRLNRYFKIIKKNYCIHAKSLNGYFYSKAKRLAKLTIKKVNMSEKCTYCNGTGVRLEYSNVFNGVCFACNGKGIIKIDVNTKRAVVIKQHTRKLKNGESLEFKFWNNGNIQIFKLDRDREYEGVRCVTLEEARRVYKKPSLFYQKSKFSAES